MPFRVRDIFGAVGVALTLIALYLLLVNWYGAKEIVSEVGGTTNEIFKTLQGR